MSANDPEEPRKPKKRGPKPEHLIIAPEDAEAVLDELMSPKPEEAPEDEPDDEDPHL